MLGQVLGAHCKFYLAKTKIRINIFGSEKCKLTLSICIFSCLDKNVILISQQKPQKRHLKKEHM